MLRTGESWEGRRRAGFFWLLTAEMPRELFLNDGNDLISRTLTVIYMEQYGSVVRSDEIFDCSQWCVSVP